MGKYAGATSWYHPILCENAQFENVMFSNIVDFPTIHVLVNLDTNPAG